MKWVMVQWGMSMGAHYLKTKRFCSPCVAEMVETFGKVECPLCKAIVICDGVDEPFVRGNDD